VTSVEPLEHLPTEVPGLDAVLRGGLVPGSVYVVQGPPGSGKTILANQIAYRHAAAGGRVVYVTLMAETHARMMQNLRGMTFFEPELVPSALQYVSGYKILVDEGEQGLSRLLYAEMKARRASLLVLDGLFVVEEVSGSRAAYRAFVHGLQAFAGAAGCTVLLLTNTGLAGAGNPEHTLVDGSIELARHTGDMRTVRTLQVHKTRGSDHLLGLHHLTISDDGIAVHPRLEALLSEPTAPSEAPTGRVPIGVAGLDAMLGGGIPEASTTIVLGPSGVGKTTLALTFLAGATPEAPAVMLGLFETPPRLRERARRIGVDLAALEDAGAVELLRRPPLDCDPDAMGRDLLSTVRRRGARGHRHPGRDRAGRLLPRPAAAVLHRARERAAWRRGDGALLGGDAGPAGRQRSRPPAALCGCHGQHHPDALRGTGRPALAPALRPQGPGQRLRPRGPRVRDRSRRHPGAGGPGRLRESPGVAAILVVEDEWVIAVTYEMALSAAGHEVTAAADGREALALAAQRRFDLVVTDFMMPRMDGLAFLRELRGTSGYTTTPAVLATAIPRGSLPQVEAGLFDRVLAKPFRDEALVKTVDELLQQDPGQARSSGSSTP
jgi:circadian clock protein KaiC